MANGFNQSKLDELNRKSGKLGKAPSFVLPAPQATGGEVPRPQAAAGGAPRPMLKRPEGGRITPVGFSDRQEAFRQKQDIIQGKTLEKRKIALSEAQGRADAPRIAADRAAKAAAAAANKLALVERPAEIREAGATARADKLAASTEGIATADRASREKIEAGKVDVKTKEIESGDQQHVNELAQNASEAEKDRAAKKDEQNATLASIGFDRAQRDEIAKSKDETARLRIQADKDIAAGKIIPPEQTAALATAEAASNRIESLNSDIALVTKALGGLGKKQDKALDAFRKSANQRIVDAEGERRKALGSLGSTISDVGAGEPARADIQPGEAPAGEEGAPYDIKSEGGDIGELVKFAADNGLDIQRKDDINLTGTPLEARARALMALRDATFRKRVSGEISEQHDRLTEEVYRLTGIAAEVWGQNFFDEGVDKTPPVSTVHDANNDGSVNEADVQKIVKMTTFLDSIKKLRELSPNDPQLKEREEDIKEAEEVVKQLDAHRRKRAKELVARATGEQA